MLGTAPAGQRNIESEGGREGEGRREGGKREGGS